MQHSIINRSTQNYEKIQLYHTDTENRTKNVDCVSCSEASSL